MLLCPIFPNLTKGKKTHSSDTMNHIKSSQKAPAAIATVRWTPLEVKRRQCVSRNCHVKWNLGQIVALVWSSTALALACPLILATQGEKGSQKCDSMRFSQKPDVNSSIFVQVVGPKGPPGPMVNKHSYLYSKLPTKRRIEFNINGLWFMRTPFLGS